MAGKRHGHQFSEVDLSGFMGPKWVTYWPTLKMEHIYTQDMPFTVDYLSSNVQSGKSLTSRSRTTYHSNHGSTRRQVLHPRQASDEGTTS